MKTEDWQHLKDESNSNNYTEAYVVSNADDFVRFLDMNNSLWKFDPHKLNNPKWIFRGHGDSRRKLIPTVWRPECRKLLEAFSEIKVHEDWGNPENSCRWYQFLPTHLAAELTIVREFLDLADEVGQPIPGVDSFPDAQQIHQTMMLPDGRSLDTGWIASIPFAVAQHHGIPTRLLDFTRNPYVAAFFAARSCQKLLHKAKDDEKPSHLELWALNQNRAPKRRVHDFYQPLRSFIPPRHQIPYLHAQSGTFVYVDSTVAHPYFAEHKKWPDFEEAIEAYRGMHGANPETISVYTNVFARISLPAKECDELLDRLWARRISLAHLMPTLDCVTRTLFEQHLNEYR